MKFATKMVAMLVVGLMFFSSPAVFAAGDNYATVNVAKLFDEYQKTKDNDATLQEEGTQKQKEKDAIADEVRKMKDELELLNDDAKKAKQDAIDQKVRELQDFDLQVRRTLGEKRQAVIKEIFNDIDGVVQKYGQAKGYDYILNDRALLYQNKKFDITDKILEDLNKNYVKVKKS